MMQKQKFIDQLSKLVSFKTLSGNQEENRKALDYVEMLIEPGAIIKRVKNKNAEIFIASNIETNSPDICYMVHIDVVSAKPSQFKLKIKGDKLYGRGVSDMKFSIPLGVEILNSYIIKKKSKPFTLVITTDEEIGGFDGAFYLSEKFKFKPKLLIVPDGGDNMNFVEKAKGVCQILITATGIPAHASRPWQGKNALDMLVKTANQLLKIYEEKGSKESWETTMNIGQITGGVSTNQVCAEATMKLDFRYPETDSIENILDKVKHITHKISSNITIEKLSTGLPTFTNSKLPVASKFIKSMEKAYGKKIVINFTHGASDARHFSKYEIPILMMKPLGGEIHSDTEWISLSSTFKFLAGLKDFLDY